MAPRSASAMYRFVFTRTRAQGSDHEKPELQLAEVDILNDSGESILVPGTIAHNPQGSAVNPQQTVSKVIDHNMETKWLDGQYKLNNHKSILEIVLPSAQHNIALYRLWTANDVIHRDPVSWALEMRLVSGEWAVIDTQTNVPAPAERLAVYESGERDFFRVNSVANLAGWQGAASLRPPPLRKPPSPPLPQSASPPPWTRPPPPPSSVNAEAYWGLQQLLSLPPTPPPMTMEQLQTVVSASDDVEPSSAAVILMIIALPFVLMACVNVLYLWRKAISRTLKSMLSEEQYATLLRALEVRRGTGPWEWAASRLEQAQAWLETAKSGAGGIAFTRISSSGADPNCQIDDDFQAEPVFTVDKTSSCDWGSTSSSSGLPRANEKEEDEDYASGFEDEEQEHEEQDNTRI